MATEKKDTYLLHIETATKTCSVALSLNGELINLREVSEDNYSHSENLTNFIVELVKESRINLKKLSGVSVSSGPGSYTGLRIGVSTAKGLCYALKIPIIAIDSLTALTELVKEEKSILAAIDARRMEIFSLISNSQGKVLKPINADVVDKNSYQEFEPFIVVGDSNKKLQELWANRANITFANVLPSAQGQIKPAWRKFKEKAFEDVAYFEPFYLKDFKTNNK